MFKRILQVIGVLIFSLIFVYPVQAQLALPDYKGYVNDFENILTNDAQLEETLSNFEKETSVEIAVVTVADFGGTTIDDYAVKLFEKWKIGKADKDNGLLVIVSSTQRQSRFEVGYGLEGTLPDSLTGRIQDFFMIPYFKNNDYSKGVEEGINSTIGVIKNDPTVISSLEQKTVKAPSDAILIFFVFLFYIMAGTKSWWFGGVLGFGIGMYFAVKNGIYLLPFITTPLGLFIDFILSKTPFGRFIIANSIGRSLGGSSSGGGMSFGGGSSGGGGSSRSW